MFGYRHLGSNVSTLMLFFTVCLGLSACTSKRFDNVSDENDPRIVGGTEVESTSVLGQNVALLYNSETTEVCTVTILNNQFALTAAHCVDDAEAADLRLIFDSQKRDTNPTRQVVQLKAFANIPNNGRSTNTGDIALVRFAGGVPKGYTAAKFLPDSNLIKDNALVAVAGYGVNDEKRIAGAGVLRTLNIRIANARYSESEVTLDQHNKSGVCNGDSGGPVFLQSNGKYYLWGVISRSINPRNCSEEAVVTNALLYATWIYATVVEMAQQQLPLTATN